MSTIADKLTSIYDTKTLIKEAITRKGGVVTENMPFSNYPSAIDGLNVLPAEPYSEEWRPNSTWWDVETILTNDVNGTYPYSYIVLLTNYALTTALSGGVAYKTSDGVYYTTATATHIWDATKDKDCNEGYKTRWIIVYSNTRIILLQNVLKPLTAIGYIFKCDITVNSSTAHYTVIMESIFFFMLNTYKYLMLWAQGPTWIDYERITRRRKTCELYPPATIESSPFYFPYYISSSDTVGTSNSSVVPVVINIPSNLKGNSIVVDGSLSNNYQYRFIVHIGAYCPYVLIKECGGVTLTGSSKNYPLCLSLIADIGTNNAPTGNFCTNITLPQGYNWYIIDLRYCRTLSLAVYRHIINSIQDNTGKPLKYFYVNTTTNDNLTTADKLLLASKNWTLSVQNV